MGEMPVGYSLERIDVNKNYCPENCEWIPKGQQPDNTRRSVWLEYGGILWRPTLLARLLNMSADQLRRWARLGRKLEFEVERYKRLRLA
jgi:hypothetical protein